MVKNTKRRINKMSVIEKNFIQLYFDHGDSIDKDDMDKINEWLSNSDTQIRISVDTTEDGVRFNFFKS